MDDANCFLTIRLGPKTSVFEKNVTVVFAVPSCDVTYFATALRGSASKIRSSLKKFIYVKIDILWLDLGRDVFATLGRFEI